MIATKKLGNSADMVLMTKRALGSYSFLSRLDEFFDVYQGRPNLPQNQVYADFEVSKRRTARIWKMCRSGYGETWGKWKDKN